MKKISCLIVLISLVLFAYTQELFTYSSSGNKVYYNEIDSLSML